MNMGRMTISISQGVKRELLREMSKLQLKLGRLVDFEDIIWWLIIRSRGRPEMLERACRPVKGVSAEMVIEELLRERRIELEREES